MKVQIKISERSQIIQPPPIRYIGWRCLHEAEGGDASPDQMPVVRPSVNAEPVDFNEGLQWLSYNLNKFNSNFTTWRWRAVYGNTVAFTNTAGFNDPSDPRRDYINRLDLNARNNPKLMKAIICGGSFFRGDATNMVVKDGKIVSGTLWCIPGIHAIDANKPAPSVDEVIEKVWYFTATTRKGDRINNFPQGQGMPVYIPFILREPTPYPLVWFAKWEANFLPDPLKYYA